MPGYSNMKFIIYFFLFYFMSSQLFSVDLRPSGEPGKTYVINGTTVNIRSKQSTSSPKIGTLKKEDEVILIEEDINEETIEFIQAPWVKVQTIDGNLTGWIFGGYLVDLGESKPAIGYQCIDFKKSPIANFQGGCGEVGSKNTQLEGACLVEFGKDKKISLMRDLGRIFVSGKWELQGNKIIATFNESSKDLECGDDTECIKQLKVQYGKENSILSTSKIEFTVNPTKNILVGKGFPGKDPSPVPQKESYKSYIKNENLTCVIPY